MSWMDNESWVVLQGKMVNTVVMDADSKETSLAPKPVPVIVNGGAEIVKAPMDILVVFKAVPMWGTQGPGGGDAYGFVIFLDPDEFPGMPLWKGPGHEPSMPVPATIELTYFDKSLSMTPSTSGAVDKLKVVSKRQAELEISVGQNESPVSGVKFRSVLLGTETCSSTETVNTNTWVHTLSKTVSANLTGAGILPWNGREDFDLVRCGYASMTLRYNQALSDRMNGLDWTGPTNSDEEALGILNDYLLSVRDPSPDLWAMWNF